MTIALKATKMRGVDEMAGDKNVHVTMDSNQYANDERAVSCGWLV